MFPINFNFPYRKKDGSIITMEKALDGAGADLDLVDLDDVAVTTPTGGQLFEYDGTTGKWKNSSTIPDKLDNEIEARAKLGAHNLAPLDLNRIKALNTDGTWADNVYTINGGTLTVSADCEVTANGTFSDDTYLVLYNDTVECLDNGDYILNGGIDSDNIVYINYYLDNVYVSNVISGASDTPFTFDKSDYDTMQLGLSIKAGSISNKTFSPMIRVAEDTDPTFAPYAKTNRELTEDVTPKQVRHETLNDTNFGGDIYVHQVGRIVYVEGDIQIKTAVTYNTTVIGSVPQALSTACGMCVGGDGSCKGRLGISGTDLIASSNLTAGYAHIAMSYLAK